MEKTIRKQIASVEDGTWKEDGCFFFYDWFCKDSSLERKAKSLIPKVQYLVEKMGIDPDTHYFFLKNNCPMSSPLYDSFSICDTEGNVKVWATPNYSPKGTAQVYTAAQGFSKPWIEENNWRKLKQRTFE
jgi:hypothetical protein